MIEEATNEKSSSIRKKQRPLLSTRKKQPSHASSMLIGPNLMTEEGTGIVVGLPGF